MPAGPAFPFSPYFCYRGGRLYGEGVPLDRIAEAVGTPVYVYSRAALESAWSRFAHAFADVPHTICYSVKACSNLAILRVLARLGSGFDIVSGGELERLRRLGIAGSRIVFSGVGKTREELRAALRARLLLFNVESEEELAALSEEATRLGQTAPAALRVNPDIPAGAHPHISTGRRVHKFGVDWKQAVRVYRAGLRLPGIRWRGMSMHLGSQILSLVPFRTALRRLVQLVRELERVGVSLQYLDLGGGFGLRYWNERPPAIEAYARLLGGAVRALGCHLLLEPGRAIAGPAGVLLTRLIYRKRNRGRLFYVVDAGMNDFLRPALYGAVHPVVPVRQHPQAASGRASVVGPICESADTFVENWPLPALRPGELLAIWGTGAYGFVLASNYNSRPRPAEVLIEGRRFRVIRQRETVRDLLRGERP